MFAHVLNDLTSCRCEMPQTPIPEAMIATLKELYDGYHHFSPADGDLVTTRKGMGLDSEGLPMVVARTTQDQQSERPVISVICWIHGGYTIACFDPVQLQPYVAEDSANG